MSFGVLYLCFFVIPGPTMGTFNGYTGSSVELDSPQDTNGTFRSDIEDGYSEVEWSLTDSDGNLQEILLFAKSSGDVTYYPNFRTSDLMAKYVFDSSSYALIISSLVSSDATSYRIRSIGGGVGYDKSVSISFICALPASIQVTCKGDTLEGGTATIIATGTKPSDSCEQVPSLSVDSSSPINCNTNSTSQTCEFSVSETGTYTVTATLLSITGTCNSIIDGTCKCWLWAFGLFLGPTVIVPLTNMVAQTIIILFFVGVIPICSACCTCTKASKLFQLKIQCVIQSLLWLLDLGCTIAIGVAYDCNKREPDHCNCMDESPLYMVIVSPIILAVYLAFVLVEILVVKNYITDENKYCKPCGVEPADDSSRPENRDNSEKHPDLPEGVAVRDPLKPRILPPIKQSSK